MVKRNLDMIQHERIDHINIVNWFKRYYPELEEDFHHFANERRCTPQEGQMLKRMGVKKEWQIFSSLCHIMANPAFGLSLNLEKTNRLKNSKHS